MNFDPIESWKPFKPTDSKPWNRRRVAHLYRRAGFGASRKQLDEGLGKTPAELIDSLFSKESSRFSQQMKNLEKQILAGGNVERLPQYWLYRMVKSDVQLREKSTLFWHGHFATSAAKVDDVGMMLDQMGLLRENSLGSFKKMVQGVSRDPAMLTYLDSKENRKTRPNENYARELMELFCLGLGNYSEDDIKQIARTFTGWEIKNDRFRFNMHQHDYGVKSFLGHSGEFNGEDAVRIVLSQKSSVEFIATKLVNFFVTDHPFDKEFIQPVARKLAESNFDIGASIRMILESQIFYDSVGAKIRSPVELAVGLLRNIEATGNFVELSNQIREQGQLPFFPPNVKGWPGGRTWINSATLLSRLNLVNDVIHDGQTKYEHGGLSGLLSHYGIDSADAAVSFFDELFFAKPIPKPARKRVEDMLEKGGIARESNVRNAFYSLAALPEFQLG